MMLPTQHWRNLETLLQASASYTQSILCTGYVPCVTDALSTQGCASESNCDCRIQNTLIHTDTATHRHTHTHTPHTLTHPPHTRQEVDTRALLMPPSKSSSETKLLSSVCAYRGSLQVHIDYIVQGIYRAYTGYIYRVYIGYIFMHKESTPSASLATHSWQPALSVCQ